MFESLSINDKYEYLIKCSNSYYESGINLIDDLTFDKYVDLYEIEVLENPKNDEYQKIQEEFAKQLKEVLFTLQHGEF